MKKVQKKLSIAFGLIVAVAIVTVAVFELGALLPGGLTDDKTSEFLCMMLMELFTIASIPVALRLFKTKSINRKLAEGKANALIFWGMLRIMLLGIPLLANTLFYYMFMQTTFAYLAIILLLCLAFVYPSMERCNHEVNDIEE